MNQIISFFTTLGLLLTAAVLHAQPSPGSDHVDVTLISDTSVISPGDTATLGFHMVIEEGWHTYWKNPGDSGIPARVSWSGADGFETGDILWPWPETFQEEHLITHGYKLETLLIVPFSADADLEAGSYELTASLEYLVCEKVCLPAFEEHTITVEVGSETEYHSDNSALVARFKEKLPETDHVLEPAFTVDEGNVLLRLTGDLASLGDFNPDAITFYGYKDDMIEPSAPQEAQLADDALWVKLRQSRYASGTLSELSGVLVIRTKSGVRALDINASH
ncbi:MAG: hypothetical protein LAT84_13960 [Balneolia bacterium]|nr:hypothetical protein [Balneolia bacterium]